MASRRAFYRMPLGYGPFPGPRQSSQGIAHSGWEEVKSTTCVVSFKASKQYLASFLPHDCFTIDNPSTDELSFASVSFTRLENLPWLAGRGYNHAGLYIHDVVCKGNEETVRGKYLSVLFENRADPITSGREELGYAKVFGTLDEEINQDDWKLVFGWEGANFGQMILRDLQNVPIDAAPPLRDSHGPSDGILHFKYIPKTGYPGESDVEYPTFSPNPPMTKSKLLSISDASTASVEFEKLDFQRLPTLHHIAEKLAGIQIEKVVGARMIKSLGAADFAEQRAIVI